MQIGLNKFEIKESLGSKDLEYYIDKKEKQLSKMYILEFISSIIMVLITMW